MRLLSNEPILSKLVCLYSNIVERTDRLLSYESTMEHTVLKRTGQKPIRQMLSVGCVLIGLFFSNSEGIRLLPFPGSNVSDDPTAVSSRCSEGKVRYSPGINTSRFLTKSNLKFQTPYSAFGSVPIDPSHSDQVLLFFHSVSHTNKPVKAPDDRPLLPEKRGPPAAVQAV